MNIDEFQFDLPEELIATKPAQRRGESRLLVVDNSAEPPSISHHQFADIVAQFREGDVLVRNNSRVIPARLYGKTAGGGLVEVLVLETDITKNQCTAMVRPGRKLTEGKSFKIDGFTELDIEILQVLPDGTRQLQFPETLTVHDAMEKSGVLPLPPYILRQREKLLHKKGRDLYDLDDEERYQTVYAAIEGSIAAPTAGLHFNDEILRSLTNKGVQICDVTLHVGAGTFKPVEENLDISKHPMHTEEYEVSEETAQQVNSALEDGRRVIACGTTSVRTLESAVDPETARLRAGKNATQLMIAPGFEFKATHAMITNFHLPRSTLLLLVSAFMGKELILRAYNEAVRERYQFFSYGDSMLLLPTLPLAQQKIL